MFAIAFAPLFDFMYTLSRNRTIGEGFRVRLWLLRSLQASAQGIKKAKQARVFYGKSNCCWRSSVIATTGGAPDGETLARSIFTDRTNVAECGWAVAADEATSRCIGVCPS
jgi:hypothetical protein